MLKKRKERSVFLLTAAVMTMLLIPALTVPALASVSASKSGSLSVDGLGWSISGDDRWERMSDNAKLTWEANAAKINGSATGYKLGKFIVTTYEVYTTLTLTNNKGTTADLSFDYRADLSNGGSVDVGGNTAAEGHCDFNGLADGASVQIKLTSPSGPTTSTITISEITLVDPNANPDITFLPAEHGTYKVDGTDIAVETKKNDKRAEEGYKVVATPATDYKLMGWYSSSGTFLSQLESTTLYLENDQMVYPIFVPESTAIFEAGSQLFTDLNDASDYAVAQNINTIVLVGDGTLPEGSYAIPSGKTLLIPFDDAHTLCTTAPGYYLQKTATLKAYKTLTMASGAVIDVQGAISVSAMHSSTSGPNTGVPTGNYGWIKMQENSQIKVKNGGKLYAWGFITGEKGEKTRGSITAESGATVYEYFQIADWRGGTASSSMILEKKVFPFSQFYVQNIEVPLTLEYGATENAYTTISASSLTGELSTYDTTVPFIGKSGSMFNLSSGTSFIKSYDPDTDRVTYGVNGDATLGSISMSMGGKSLDSADFVLPINNNIILSISAGTTTVKQDVALLPGVQAKIASGGTLLIASGYNTYLYDKDQWGNYVRTAQFLSVPFTPTKNYNRTASADLLDVSVDVNGTIRTTGYLYTTAGGADIKTSQGSGKVILTSGAGTATTTTQATQSGSDITYVDIPITSAQLHNGGMGIGTADYTATAEAAARTTYHYCTYCDKWYTGSHYTVKLYADGSTEPSQTACSSTDSVTFSNVTKVIKSESSPACTVSADANGLVVSGLTTGLTEVRVWTKAAAQIVDAAGTMVSEYISLQDAVAAYDGNGYIRMIENSKEPGFTIDKAVYLDLNGKTVTLTSPLSDSVTLYGMDSSVTDYTSTPKGKLTCSGGTVSTITENSPTGEYYVAIPNGDGSYSFHHYNIYVSGYRFELDGDYKDENGVEHALGALIFQATLKGNDAVAGYMSEYTVNESGKVVAPFGFTLNDIELSGTKTGENSSWNAATKQFEAYWRGYVTADNIATDHTAQAWVTFKDGKTKQSVEVQLSYLNALLKAADENNAAGINAFLTKLGRTERVTVTTTN